MPENQGHGKLWELDVGVNICKAKRDVLEKVPQTAIFDIPKEHNLLDGIDTSVKVSVTDSFGTADILRFYDTVSSGQPFHLIGINCY